MNIIDGKFPFSWTIVFGVLCAPLILLALFFSVAISILTGERSVTLVR